uniref:Major facilitator superfamily (MFS) profile domain-containing protein n=1 Tax=Chromera velia CCMP2878 TaxID=1169474 RepID=A0A0G4FCH5_9ALVE|eukprot:Cvel_16207.t1-p1 / transcript=Cvel_16207.t1 / gene=Cvel_16207 / organism=Chromera_velia_CCMP2878 / gene_product=hypothetical protein / transcript_product=hypothetical protein / location=Cvel_scaffold1238:12624-18652(+) / protein_length=462 / sequence_SO=supercontig / SO=protein_coding / is_pseudo=false
MALHKADLRPIWVVFCAFVYNLTLGSAYCFSNIAPYVASFMRQENARPIRHRDMSYVYIAAMTGIGCTLYLGGKLEHALGPRLSAVVGGLLMSMSVFFSHLTVDRFEWFILTQGLLYGIGNGIAFPAALSCAIRWIPHRKGLVSGIVTAGIGLSPLIIGPLQTLLVNPKNKPPTYEPFESSLPQEKYYDDREILANVPRLFQFQAAFMFSVQFVTALFLVNPPPSRTDIDVELQLKKMHSDDAESRSLSPAQLIRSRAFWILWGVFAFSAVMVSFIASFWKLVGQEAGLADHVLGLQGSVVLSVGSVVGRLLWGQLHDLMGFRKTMGLLLPLAAVLLFLWTSVSVWLGAPAFLGMLGLLYLCVGGTFALFPPIVATAFGARHFGSNYGVMYSARVVSTLLFGLLIRYEALLPSTERLAQAAAGCATMAWFLLFVFKPPLLGNGRASLLSQIRRASLRSNNST